MGDSCTQFSDYPARTMRQLRADGLRGFMNAGVAGWSSQQGVWQMTRDIAPLRPRVVTLYYGWNDHWAGDPGADKDARRTPPLFWLGEHSRLYQLLRRATQPKVPLADRHARVSLPDYRRNLLRLAGLARRAGSAVVFITAGSNHRPGHEPRYLRARVPVKLRNLVPLHSAYQRMTREAAAEAGASLCDAAAEIERDPRRSSYFREDGIHLAPAGNERLAELLAPCIREALARATSGPTQNAPR